MARKAGPVERELMKAVRAFLHKHGHGAATKLGKKVGLRSAWITGFAMNERRAYIDDAVRIANALDIDLKALVGERYKATADTTPIDKREVLMQRLFARIKDDQCRKAALSAVRGLMEIDEQLRGVQPVAEEADEAAEPRRQAAS